MAEPGQPAGGEPRSRLWRDPGHLLACGLGSGLLPTAPGTAGTLVGLLFFFALCWLPLWAYVVITSLLFLAGVWICGRTAAALKTEDPQEVVWDEIVGFLVAATAVAPSWLWLAGAFILFRVFDIFKPWPISLVERRITGGLGIMLDDLLAGLYTLAVLHGVRWGLTWMGQ